MLLERGGGGARRQVEEVRNSLVCHENLESRNEVSQGDGLVSLPLLVGLEVIDEDDEVVLGALVVDLDLLSGTLHFECD